MHDGGPPFSARSPAHDRSSRPEVPGRTAWPRAPDPSLSRPAGWPRRDATPDSSSYSPHDVRSAPPLSSTGPLSSAGPPTGVARGVELSPSAVRALRADAPGRSGSGRPAGETALQHALRRNKLALAVPAGALGMAPGERGEHERWLAAYRLRTFAINALSLRATLEALDALEAAGVPCLAFKGPLQHERLHGDPMIRPSGDADILVPPHRFADAERVLGAAGYRAADRQALWWRLFLGERHLERDGRAAVDLHRRLHQPGCPSPRRPAAVWRDARIQVWRGRPVPVPDPADDALVAAINVAKALWHREAAGGSLLDWRAATARAPLWRDRAREQGLFPLAALTDRIARAAFDDPADGGPPDAADAADDRLVAMALAPWSVASWPRRRSLLAALCGTGPRFAREAARVALAEGVRRATAPRRRAGEAAS